MAVKPRRDSAPLTDEDCEIWLRVAAGGDPVYRMKCNFQIFLDADRRDADLMLAAMRQRAGHWGPLVRWERIDDDEAYLYTRCGGALPAAIAVDSDKACYIRYFG